MSACWHTQPSSSTTWSFDRSGLGEIVRLAENGRVRITEQEIIRIVELTAARWSLEPSSFTGWNFDLSGLGEIVRLAEDGRVRVTEQMIVRILERLPVMWTSETTPSFNNWVTEIVIDAFDDNAFDPCAFE